ncbi:MAG: cobalt-precorrin-6A reductase [Pseudomonadota bacterium]
MTTNLLILGGTMEATALCNRLAALNVRASLSLAGRVTRPKRQPLPMRVGGFGGVAGLCAYLVDAGITHVIDATHPFASQMSHNAAEACTTLDLPSVALVRPPWTAQPGDKWKQVPDIAGAVRALDRPACRVMLAVGRMHLNDFAPNPQHHYVLRLVDPPQEKLPFPQVKVLVDRGPFTASKDKALMQSHGIDLVVSKNSGGKGAVSKILAARDLGLPVIMLDRPQMPSRTEVTSVDAVLKWLKGHEADLGV